MADSLRSRRSFQRFHTVSEWLKSSDEVVKMVNEVGMVVPMMVVVAVVEDSAVEV